MGAADLSTRIDAAIGHVANFPFDGFPFRDVSPILERDPTLYRDVIDAFVDALSDDQPDRLLCIESWGYVFGAPVAYALGVPIVLARRAGKLPRDVHRSDYDMIYASGKTLEVHRDAMGSGDRVVIVDDVLAKGGSVLAALSLIEACGATCARIACLADVEILRTSPARAEIERRGIPVFSLTKL